MGQWQVFIEKLGDKYSLKFTSCEKLIVRIVQSFNFTNPILTRADMQQPNFLLL